MGEPCINMKPFMDLCITNGYDLGGPEPVQECLIPNYYKVQEIRENDAESSAARTSSFSNEERMKREFCTSPYIAFLQFVTKVMVPHGTYTRYIQKKNLFIGNLVTTDDEALAFVIMDNCIDKWNAEYDMRKDKILQKIDEIIINRQSQESDTDPGNLHNITPEKSQKRVANINPQHDWEEHSNDEMETDQIVYTKKDLEQLKGILHKDLLNKDDKSLLPITKYTEQRHDTLKMLVGWEGKGIKRFLQIKRNIKNFKENHEAMFHDIGEQSLANMTAEMKGCHERRNQRLTQYAKSEKEQQRKRDIEKVYEEEDLSPFAGNGNIQVWGL